MPWEVTPWVLIKSSELVCLGTLGKASLNLDKLSISFPCRAQHRDKKPKVNTSPVSLCPCQSQEGIRLVTSLPPPGSQEGPITTGVPTAPSLCPLPCSGCVIDGGYSPPYSHASFPGLQTSRANKPGPWTQSVSVLGTQQGKKEHETSIDPLRNDVPSLSYQILFTLQL